MTASTAIGLAHIFRYPIKAHGREELASVVLSAGAGLPWDRHWAVAHERSKFDPTTPAWVSCGNFQRGARTPAVMAITARYDEDMGLMDLTHPDLPPLRIRPDTDGDQLIDWLAPISPDADFRPTALVRAPGRGMTDTDYPSLAINSLASNAALAAHMGRDLSLHRWRGNLWLDGLDPWEEFGWIGRRLRLGETMLQVQERIGRCKATTANPDTGRVDADTLGALRAVVGEQDFGVFATVIEGGRIATGDRVEVLA
jgi:uncharacterized protein YcbX